MIKLKILNKQKPIKLKSNIYFPDIVLANFQEKNVIPTKEKQEIVADGNYDGLSKVTVESIPNEYVIPSGTLDINKNGEYDVIEKATVNVQTPIPKLDTKTINANGVYNAIDDNLDGYSSVNVEISGGDPEIEASYLSAIDDTLGANTTKLPNNLTTIGSYAFYKRTNLALTKLPNSISEIGTYAFRDCTNLALTSLPSDLTKIGSYAFYNCTNLVLTKLPSSLTTIGSYAFYICKNLSLTELPNTISEIGDYTFYNCTNVALTKLSDNLKYISNYTFQGCTSLALTELPSNITSIGNSAFQGCTKLTEMTIPSGVSRTETYTFNGCTSLNKVVFKGAMLNISASTFSGCTKLKTVVLENVTKVPTLANVNAFTNTPINSGTGYIYVPDTLVSSFKSATNWSTFANQIKGLSELEG